MEEKLQTVTPSRRLSICLGESFIARFASSGTKHSQVSEKHLFPGSLQSTLGEEYCLCFEVDRMNVRPTYEHSRLGTWQLAAVTLACGAFRVVTSRRLILWRGVVGDVALPRPTVPGPETHN